MTILKEPPIENPQVVKTRANRSYPLEVNREMSYIYLYHPKVVTKNIAKHYNILNGEGKPNHSYARQKIHKWLKLRNEKLWFTIDAESAGRNEKSLSREDLSRYRNQFFSDSDERIELKVSALVFIHDVLISEKQMRFQQQYIENNEMIKVRSELAHCDPLLVTKALDARHHKIENKELLVPSGIG